MLWAGSDDGRLHVTRDGGATWTSVEKNLPRGRGIPEHPTIPHIEPSRFDAASAFVVFDNHRRGDFQTYVARTDDWGKSWTRLDTPELRGWALAIAQDPVDRDLLFLGTELGLWVSFGNASGSVPPVNIAAALKGHLFLTRPSLQPYSAARQDLLGLANDLFEVVKAGKVKIDINQRYPIKDAVQAHKDLESRKTTGSTVLIP